MKDEQMNDNSDRWYALGEALALAIPYDPWREAPWLRPTTTDADMPGRVQAFELLEEPHRALVERAILQWLRDQKPPSLESEAMFFFASASRWLVRC